MNVIRRLVMRMLVGWAAIVHKLSVRERRRAERALEKAKREAVEWATEAEEWSQMEQSNRDILERWKARLEELK